MIRKRHLRGTVRAGPGGGCVGGASVGGGGGGHKWCTSSVEKRCISHKEFCGIFLKIRVFRSLKRAKNFASALITDFAVLSISILLCYYI